MRREEAAAVLDKGGTQTSLETLAAKDAVIGVINRLFICTDMKDWDGVKACLAERVYFDMTDTAGGKPREMTPDMIADGWKEGLAPMTALHHQAGNYVVSVKEGEAEAFCYGIAYHYRPTATGQNTRVFVGSYEFHLTDRGGWLIDSFVFNLKFVDGNRELEKAPAAGTEES